MRTGALTKETASVLRAAYGAADQRVAELQLRTIEERIQIKVMAHLRSVAKRAAEAATQSEAA